MKLLFGFLFGYVVCDLILFIREMNRRRRRLKEELRAIEEEREWHEMARQAREKWMHDNPY